MNFTWGLTFCLSAHSFSSHAVSISQSKWPMLQTIASSASCSKCFCFTMSFVWVKNVILKRKKNNLELKFSTFFLATSRSNDNVGVFWGTVHGVDFIALHRSLKVMENSVDLTQSNLKSVDWINFSNDNSSTESAEWLSRPFSSIDKLSLKSLCSAGILSLFAHF